LAIEPPEVKMPSAVGGRPRISPSQLTTPLDVDGGVVPPQQWIARRGVSFNPLFGGPFD
jgi:hypothetical protein